MLDLTLLTISHLFSFLSSFIGVFVLTAVIVHLKPPALKVSAAAKSIVFAGFPIAVVITAAAALALSHTNLQIGLIVGTVLILIAGLRDERFGLSPWQQLFWQVIIVIGVVAAGWTIPYISDPLGQGVIYLNQGAIGPWLLPGSLLAAVWLLFLMNSINWLDGVDGLAGSVATVALLALAVISLLPSTQDSFTLTLALIGAGGTLAFLVWNFAPAQVYLGTTGSWFLGLYIGLTAMLGGGKIATTLLVLALPVIDAAIVIGQRVLSRQAPWQGDEVHHLHHRLRALGLSPRAISLIALGATLLFAGAAILLQTYQKIIALIIVASVFLIVAGILMRGPGRLPPNPQRQKLS